VSGSQPAKARAATISDRGIAADLCIGASIAEVTTGSEQGIFTRSSEEDVLELVFIEPHTVRCTDIHMNLLNVLARKHDFAGDART
jgi:hypothetical protein